MEFNLTDTQRMYVDTVRRFAQQEVAPFVAEYDTAERYPIEIVQKMGPLGLLGGVIPEKYGGQGLDYMTMTVGMEEMATFDPLLAATMGRASGLIGSSLLKYGTEEQKQKYLVPLARGEFAGGTAVTEPHSGTDVAAMETTVRNEGDHYVINGSKIFISGVGFNKWFLTFATLDRKAGPKAICAFIVDTNSPGFSTRTIKNKCASRPTPLGELIFEDCIVPKENLVGKEGEGLRVAISAVTEGRLAAAARAVGISQACLNASVKYAKERIVFGKTIATYQLVQSKIADMVVGTQAARYFLYRLAYLKDQGATRIRQEAAIAKYYSCQVAMQSALDAVQIYGGYAIMPEYLVGKYFRDAKFLQIVEGQHDLQKVLIAEYALGLRQDRH